GGKRNGGSRLENENKAARPATHTIRDPAPAARLFAEDILLPQPALPRWTPALRTWRHSLKSARPLARQCHARLGDRPWRVHLCRAEHHPSRTDLGSPRGQFEVAGGAARFRVVAGFTRGRRGHCAPSRTGVGGGLGRSASALERTGVASGSNWLAAFRLVWPARLLLGLGGRGISEPACGFGIRASPS